MPEIRVQLPVGPLEEIWKVAGYGWPGRIANACSLRGMRVRIPHLPLGPDGEMEIIPRFYRGVPGSSPGRGA
jgi:hypothetical protein